MLIGYDGLAVNFGTSATAYIGSESTTINYGNYGLQISSSGVKRLVGGEWKGINRLKIRSFSVSTALGEDDDFLIFQGQENSTLTLGTGESGRIIYVKDRGSGRLTLQGTIYRQNDRNSSSSVDLSDTMVFLISDGVSWYMGYCG